MDILQPLQKWNTKPVNMVLIYSVISLLGLNYLLYSFFDLGSVRNLVRAAVAGLMLILLVLRLAEDKIHRREMLMLLLALWQILMGGTNGLNLAFLLILTVILAGYRECRIATVVFRVMTALSVLVALCLVLGIEENEIYTVGTRTRHKLGFINVNAASMFFFSALAAYLLHRGGKVKLWEIAIVLAVEGLIFVFTDSRTPLLCLVIMAALYLLLPRLPEKAVRLCCRVGIGLLFLSPYLWVMPVFNSPLVNKILSLRPMYCDEYFRSQNAFTFLLGGTRIPELDNGYLLLLFNIGVILYTAVCFLVRNAAERLHSGGEYMPLAYAITMLLCSVMEGSVLRPELLCAPLLWVILMGALPASDKPSFLAARARLFLSGSRGKNTKGRN